jgi:hypothetical protein
MLYILYSTLKPIAMKSHKLVTVSFTTRMIVDESASESK